MPHPRVRLFSEANLQIQRECTKQNNTELFLKVTAETKAIKER